MKYFYVKNQIKKIILREVKLSNIPKRQFLEN